MAKETTGKTPLSPAVIIAALVIVAAVVGFLGWRTMGGGTEPPKVKIDAEQIKQDLKSGKTRFGH